MSWHLINQIQNIISLRRLNNKSKLRHYRFFHKYLVDDLDRFRIKLPNQKRLTNVLPAYLSKHSENDDWYVLVLLHPQTYVLGLRLQIGRASCRERVWSAVVAGLVSEESA